MLKVINDGNYIQHFVEPIDGFFVGQEVDISIDCEWRLMCSRLHTAGHLIAGVIEEAYPELRAIAGHHWPGESRVEFEGDCDVPELGFLSAVNSRLAKVIAENLLVHAQCAEGVGRLVQVGQYTPVPCGGTHVRATGELGNVQIVSARNKKGKFRVSYEVAV